jgi:hypothetical protein
MKEHILEIFLLSGRCGLEFITNHLKVMALGVYLRKQAQHQKANKKDFIISLKYSS